MSNSSAEAFDKVGFDTLETISRAKHFNDWMYQSIHPHIKGKVLELGSGIGNVSEFLINGFNDITLSDYQSTYFNFLKKKYGSHNSIKGILQIDLQDSNFHLNTKSLASAFDTVILLNVIEHLKDDNKAVQYCHSLLKTGGHFIILAPAHKILYSLFDKELGHYRRYSSTSLDFLLTSNGFTIVKSYFFNVLGMIGWFVFNTIGQRKQLKNSEVSTFNQLVPIAKKMDKLIGKRTGLSIIAIGKKN